MLPTNSQDVDNEQRLNVTFFYEAKFREQLSPAILTEYLEYAKSTSPNRHWEELCFAESVGAILRYNATSQKRKSPSEEGSDLNQGNCADQEQKRMNKK